MNVGDKVRIEGTINQLHDDGSCWIVLPTGQSFHTDQRNCVLVEAAPVVSAHPSNADGLEKLKAKDLLEICASEGITFNPGAPKSALIEAIRLKRKS